MPRRNPAGAGRQLSQSRLHSVGPRRKIYYYLVVSARVEGKPRIVEQTYLGTAEDIAAVMAGATAVPQRFKHLPAADPKPAA